MRSVLQPLSVGPFGRVLTSYTVNLLGDFLGLVALALLVFDETGDPLAVSALFACMQFIPGLLAPALTARIDQIPPRVILPGLFLAEGAMFAILALLADAFSLPLVLAIALLDGVLMLSARGITRAVVNETLEPAGLLRQGNSILNFAYALATVVGTSIGGVLVGAFGVATALWIDAATFAAVAALLATANNLRSARVAEREPFRTRFAAGLRFAGSHAVVRLLLVGETVAVLFFALVVPVEVVFAKESLGTTDAGYGLLLATWGAGAVLGSLVFVRLAGQLPRVIVGSTVMIGLAYVGMGLSSTLAVATAFAAVGGIGNGMQWVGVMTAVQEATPADLQARIAGLLESSTSAVMGLGFLLGGLLAAATAADTTFVIAGVATLVLVAVGALAALRLRPRPRPAAPSAGASAGRR